MNRLLMTGSLGFFQLFAAVSLAQDSILDHPLFARPDAVVQIDKKTTASALEIIPPCFARKVQGSTLEINTTKGWGQVERRQMMTPKEAEKFIAENKQDPYALCIQSILHLIEGHNDKSLAVLNTAVKANPKFAMALYGRGNVYAEMGDYEKAAADFMAAVKAAPADLIAANDLAWFRATCPQAKFRDSKQAMAEATRVCEATGYQHEEFLDTLAAACADAGDFKAALKWASKAAEIDPENEDFADHIKLYKAQKPLREEVTE